ncbi:hypothetical protein KF840_19330 [bacterium]|nr:hypothetical protein [bacterium]
MPSRRSWFIAALLIALVGGKEALAAEVTIPLAEAQDSLATVDLILLHEGVVSATVEGSLDFVSPLRIRAGDNGAPQCLPSKADSVIAGTFAFTPPGCTGEECTGVRFSLTFSPPTDRDIGFARCNVELAPKTPPGFYELPLHDVRMGDADRNVIEARAVSEGVSVPELPRQATIVIDTIEGRPGEVRYLDVVMDTTVAARIERVGMTIVGDPHTVIPFAEDDRHAVCEVNPAIDKNDSEFYGSRFGGFSAEILGSYHLIPTGSRLFTCRVEIAEDTPPGRYPLTCLRRDAYDTTDGFISTNCVSGAVNVLPGLPGTPTSTRIPTPSPEAAASPPATMTVRTSSGSGCDVSSDAGNGWGQLLVMVLVAIPLSKNGQRALLAATRVLRG